MTFADLQQALAQQTDLAACAQYLAANAQAVRDLFYQGVVECAADTPPIARAEDIQAETALVSFLNTPAATQMRSGGECPPSVAALLIYFIAVCERAGFKYLLKRIAHTLPQGDLLARISAIFEYRYIPRAKTDYIGRFDLIADYLQSTWQTAAPSQKAQCEDMVIEYFCAAAAPGNGIGAVNAAELLKLFKTAHNQTRYPLLNTHRIAGVLCLPPERLPQERDEANIRIAEAFYDEAAQLLPVPPPPPEPSECLATGKSHAGHCPPGLHEARVEIQTRFRTEFTNTAHFIKQPLNAATYTEFNDTTKCMRYFRQYMPLHMPQVEQAVCQTLDGNHLPRKRVNVIDIGGGPGTLYTVLASILRRSPYQDYRFDVTLVDPSVTFQEFLTIVAKHVTHPNLTLREMCACTSDKLPQFLAKKDADWYFIANAITPIVKGAGGHADKAVDDLCRVIVATRRRHCPCILTIAENTMSTDFPAVLAALGTRGLQCTEAQTVCSGAWLKDCRYRVAYSSAQTPAPRLKYACVHIPEGFSVT